MCFERRFSKQNSVIRLKFNILAYTVEYWQYVLPNTVYTFVIFRVWGGPCHSASPPYASGRYILPFWPISGLNNLKLTFQFNDKARIFLILCSKYMNKILKSWTELHWVDDHNELTTCSKPSLSSHMNERVGTLENKQWLMTGPTETLVAQNLQDCRPK